MGYNMKKKLALFSFLFLIMLAVNGQDDESFYSVKRPKRITSKTKINYDLTKMNYNIASGLLFDMLIEPEKYANKTIKIKGQFHSEIYENKRIFAILIWDMTGCCPSGLSVVPLSTMKYPDDFPDSGYYTTITGTLELLDFAGDAAIYLIPEKWES